MDDENPFLKAQTIDPEVRAYVYSLVNALGGSSADEDGRYVLGDDALACLRDLKRWLKLYDEKTNRLDVARCLVEAKLVTGDLLPIFASWSDDGKNDRLKARVALAVLELLVPLTWPLENIGEMTVNHHRHTPYIQQSQVLYKAGILSWDTCAILRQVVRIGLPSIALSRDERTNRDEGIIKLMLYFLRNVTVIRQIPNLPSQGLEMEVSRSATIEAFRQQDVFALLLTICSNMGDDFNLQDVIVLEILFNLVKGVDVNKLWMTEEQRKGREISDLKASLAAENSLLREAKLHQPTRHGRFGTMIWVRREDEKMSAVSGQDNLRDGQKALFNMDKTKKWSKPQQKRKDMDHTIHDFNRSERLTSSATEKLRNFVEEFLDSGFNPLFTHLRKAIEREAERVLDVNYRQFFYTVSWFLEAERVRREKQKKETRPANITADFEVESYSLVAAVLNQETFITLNRYMQNSFDNKEWQDLNASMRCFTQILLTVQEMAQSPLDEDQEIADNIQNRIFYEETTHDRIASILKGYKDQGFGYLDACTELSHVFLRMLERYSRENVDLQIRSRRRARQKKKDAKDQARKQGENAENDDDDDDESENEDIAEVAQISKERKFDFKRFAAKFTNQSSVNTYVAFLTFYRDLSVDQLKRAHRFFYRVAFKQELAILLYRVDIVALFYKINQGPEGLDRSHSTYKEWSEFSKQLLKKMFKKLEQRPELMVEMLFSKITATLYYLEYGQEKQTLAMTRAPAELEVRPAPGRDIKEQIGVVVTVLMKDEKSQLVKWVAGMVEKAYDERSGWEAEAQARKAVSLAEAEQGNEEVKGVELETPSYITVRATSDEIQTAMFKNARLKLLMKLCGFEILGGEDALGAIWIIPSSLGAEQLCASKAAIEEYATTPWQPEHEDESAEDLIRRVRNLPSRGTDDDEEEARRDAFIDDSEGNDDVEDFMFPDNLRQKPTKKPRDIIAELKAKRRKRKRADGDEESEDDGLADERRKARKAAEYARRMKIKSELYIRDSDDETDEEEDREFFRKEEELRKRQDANVKRQMALGIAGVDAPKGKKAKKIAVSSTQESELDLMLGAGIASDDGDGDLHMFDHDDDQNETASSQPQRRSDSDAENASQEDTPLSSPTSILSKTLSKSRQQLGQVPQPQESSVRAKMEAALTTKEDDELEADDEEIVLTAQRRVRAGFIIDSDDDE